MARTPTAIESLGGSTYCGYTAIQFQSDYNLQKNKLLYELRQLIKKYYSFTDTQSVHSEEEKSKIYKQILEKVRQLKQEKVIVIVDCSC